MEPKKATTGEKMAAHIAACRASGLNVRTYCLEHKITPSNYYYWLAKSREPVEPGKFISIPVPAPVTNVPVHIAFANGTRVCFENLPPADYVKKLVG